MVIFNLPLDLKNLFQLKYRMIFFPDDADFFPDLGSDSSQKKNLYQGKLQTRESDVSSAQQLCVHLYSLLIYCSLWYPIHSSGFSYHFYAHDIHSPKLQDWVHQKRSFG